MERCGLSKERDSLCCGKWRGNKPFTLEAGSERVTHPQPARPSAPAGTARPYRIKPKRIARLPLRWRLFKSLSGALVIWIGETVIGLIPLATHYLVATYSRVGAREGHDAVASHLTSAPLAEMNILAVVISGLGLLSLLRFGHHGRQARLTPMTHLAGLAALLLLITSSVLYALTAAEIGAGNGNVTQAILIFAVLVSLFLALEPAWLEALNDT